MKTSIFCIALLAMLSAGTAKIEDCTEEICEKDEKSPYTTPRCYKVERPELPPGIFNGSYEEFKSPCDLKIHECKDRKTYPTPSGYRRLRDGDQSCNDNFAKQVLMGLKENKLIDEEDEKELKFLEHQAGLEENN